MTRRRAEQLGSRAADGEIASPARRGRAARSAGQGARPARPSRFAGSAAQPPRPVAPAGDADRPGRALRRRPRRCCSSTSTASRCSTTAFGHTAGDAALIQVAEMLVGGVRAERHGRAARRRRIRHPARSCRRGRAPARPPSGWSTRSPTATFRHEGDAHAAERRDRRDDDRATATLRSTVMARADKAMYRVKAAA